MKYFLFSALALSFAAASAQASEVFTLTQTPDTVVNTSNSTLDEVWNFTVLSGWSGITSIDSIQVTIDFTGVTDPSTFAMTTIPYDTTVPNGGSKIGTIWGTTTITGSTDEQITLDIPSQLALSALGSTTGEFDTRISRSTEGAFTVDSVTISITAETPEPATFGLMGLGLLAVGFFARRRFAKI